MLTLIIAYLLDVDECTDGISGCSQICINTNGSYTCTCDNGYQLSNDNHTCNDINECTIIHNGGCEQTCLNTNGSFACSCTSGYQLLSDKFCTGKIMYYGNTIIHI